MSAPIPGFELTVEDCLRVTDWMMWVYPAPRRDRQLNRQIVERCGLALTGPETLSPASALSSDPDLDMSVRDLGLPYGAIRRLEHYNIRSLVDLLRRSPDELATIPGVNRETVKLIEMRLSEWNLVLGSLPAVDEPGPAPAELSSGDANSRPAGRPIALSWDEADVVLRWYTYVPLHFRTERDRRIAEGLADFLDVPLSTFEDSTSDDGDGPDEEDTFDLVDSDDDLPALPGDVMPPFATSEELKALRLLAGDDEEEFELLDAEYSEDDDEDEDDSADIIFELDEDLARDLGIEGTPIEPDEPSGQAPEIEPIWTPDDPDAWKSGDEVDPDFWKESDEEDPWTGD